MSTQPVFTHESVAALARVAKSRVAATSDWILGYQAWPIEDAEAEYLKDSTEGDSLVSEMQRARETYYRRADLGDCWALDFADTLITSPGCVADLLTCILHTGAADLFHEYSFLTDIPAALLMLHNSAHAHDFRLKAECRIPWWEWNSVMSFRTGFEAAEYFGMQCDRFRDHCSGGNLSKAMTFSDVLEYCHKGRSKAREILHPCICVEQLQSVIDYEAAWLLHMCCDAPEPRAWDLPSELWLTDRTEGFDLHGEQAEKISVEKAANRAPDSPMPFGLQWCPDDAQLLKRTGYADPIRIKQPVYMKALKALIAAHPNAVPSRTLDEIFSGSDAGAYDRDNAPKQLKPRLRSIDLMVRDWTLLQWDGTV